jgi:hypothetical protein
VYVAWLMPIYTANPRGLSGRLYIALQQVARIKRSSDDEPLSSLGGSPCFSA